MLSGIRAIVSGEISQKLIKDRQGVIALEVARETMKNLNHDTPTQTTLLKEFAEDPTAYEIHYYNNAIFALKGSKEELKYPYLISGCLNCCPVDKDLKGLSPIHIAQSYLIKDLQPILGRKTRDYFETILVETGSVEIQHMDRNRDYAFSNLQIFFFKQITVSFVSRKPLR